MGETRVATSPAAMDATAPEPVRATDWRRLANCKGQLKLFFAPKAERPEARARREAKASRFCDACVVVAECRAYAREHREYGFWAGESEEDRYLLGYRVTAPIGVRTRTARVAEREQESA